MTGHGLFDIHCHLIPGVDDGAQDLEETRKLLYFLEKQKEYKDIHLIDYILLKHKNYIGYYWVHFIYTHLKQWRYKEKYESRNCNNYKRI